MKKISSEQIRNIWLDYFKTNNHYEMPSASLVPINDKSLLWVNSGVATLKKFFSGEQNPPSKRLTNSQKAIRTNDFFNVGVTSRHHTFFEMLGNFSIGDYFKDKAIEFAYDLLINKYGLDIDKLWFTVYENDEEAYKKWLSLGIDKNRILKCGKDRNFWDVGNGPCGPCTEIYYDRGSKYDPEKLGEKLFLEDIENDRYVEIWNIVFSQFNNDGNNNYTELVRKNIDTGAGLERLACVIQDVPTNFDTDLFQPIIKAIEKYTDYKYDVDAYFSKAINSIKINFAYRVISDHLRASVFAIADGVVPSSKERGYILRRLIRRAIVFINQLKIIDENVIVDVVNSVVEIMKCYYPYLVENKEKITKILLNEHNLFKKTLNSGLKLFENACKNLINNKIDDQVVFHLVDTYGFPIELIKELCNEKAIEIDIDAFNLNFERHQKISNAKNAEKAMEAQNEALIKIDANSKFEYETSEINDAKILLLFDNDWKPVKELTSSGYVVFDKTCFYATSGGQIHDTGLINDIYYVDDVFKGPNSDHIHHVTSANFKLGDICNLKINYNDRLDISKNHSVEHLLQSSLQNTISLDIKQEGAFKSPKKVTFDFFYHEKLNDEQLKKVQDYVNAIINKEIEVDVLEMNYDDAIKTGAKAYFEDVYKKLKGKVRIIKMGDVSMEFCGGTHVHNTKDIEQYAILDYYSKSAGSWRIEASTGFANIQNFINEQYSDFKTKAKILRDELIDLDLDIAEFDEKYNLIINNEDFTKLWTLSKIFQEFYDFATILKKKELKKLEAKQVEEVKKIFNFKNNIELIEINNNILGSAINIALNELINEHPNTLFAILKNFGPHSQYYFGINENTAKNKNINLNNLISEVNKINNGKGGGRFNLVQGGSELISCDQILNIIKKYYA